MARKGKLTIAERHKKHLAMLDPDGYAYKTYVRYAEIDAKHEALTEWLGDPKFEGKDGKVPDKHRAEFYDLCHQVDRSHVQLFAAFDQAMRTAKATFHVAEADVKQIVYDALMGNSECMTDVPEGGIERHHMMRQLAGEVVIVIRDSKVQVTDEDMNAPYCDECQAELS